MLRGSPNPLVLNRRALISVAYVFAGIGMLLIPKASAEFREKFGSLALPSEKQVARFRTLRKIVDSSNIVLPRLSRREVEAASNILRNFSQSRRQHA